MATAIKSAPIAAAASSPCVTYLAVPVGKVRRVMPAAMAGHFAGHRKVGAGGRSQ